MNDFLTQQVGPQTVIRERTAESERDVLLNGFGTQDQKTQPDSPSRTPEGSAKRKPSIGLALIAAILVGLPVTLSGRLEYLCEARLDAGQSADSKRGLDPQQLRRFVWDTAGTLSGAAGMRARWKVDFGNAGTLDLTLTTPDRSEGMTAVRWMVEAFLDHLRNQAERVRMTPSEGEAELDRSLSDVNTQLGELQTSLQEANAALPAEAPDTELAALLARWSELRDEFSVARGHLSSALADVARLETASGPAEGLILEAERKDARRADQALQQDWKELAVALTDLKLQTLTVWQQSSGPLERLIAAERECHRALAESTDAPIAAPQVVSATNIAVSVDRLTAIRGSLMLALSAYGDLLSSFASAWTNGFTAVQQTDVNPQDPTLLDAYARLRRRLHDFLFESSKQLATLRDAVQQLGSDPADDARWHVRLSQIVRLFEALHHTHHQFEFAAGSLEIPGNFRLDAAYQAAQGLHRRTTVRRREIDAVLTVQASERAHKLRVAELAAARATIDDVRQQTDQMVDDLLSLHERMISHATQSDTFLRAMLKLEGAAARFKLAQSDRTHLESRLAELQTARLSTVPRSDVRLLYCGTGNVPINLGERIRIGGIASGLTLVAVLLGQWWVLRRRS